MIVMRLLPSIFLFGLAAANAALASAPQVSLTSGAEYSSGDYGSGGNINVVYVPVMLRCQTSRFAAGLTVPYLYVQAPKGSVIDSGSTAVKGSGDTVTASGLGDVMISGTLYDVWSLPGQRMAMDLAGKIKLGTGEENDGLGTGENDYAIYANFYRWFDRATLLASLGYRFRGESPDVDSDNTRAFSVGGAYHFTDITSVGLIYDFRESPLPGSDDPSELTAYILQRLDTRWRVKGYVFTGFSDSSPDWGSGVLFEWTL